MSLKIQIVADGKSSSTFDASPDVFGKEFNETLIHQVVVAYQAAGRSGTKGQKSRADVSGGGAKPWRQKGGGRARAGTTRSPLWRTGGVTFAASNRSYRQKVNRKMYRSAMRSILSELLRQDRLIISNDFGNFKAPKTKELVSKLSGFRESKNGKVLIVTLNLEESLYLAARNLPDVDVCTAQAINPVALVSSHRVILAQEALEYIEGNLK